MAETPEQIYARARDHVDDEGRLGVPRYVDWEVFPFEGELRVKPLAEPRLPEPARNGESGADECGRCQDPERGMIWSDLSWRMIVADEPNGLPAQLIIEPREHLDLGDLDDERAAELGRLLVHVERAMRALDGVGRVHVARWGDGGAHLHVFVYARPEGFWQLRGTCLALWDDILPATPTEVWVANHASIADAVAASYGGSAVPRPAT
jgi:hypothetical protein